MAFYSCIDADLLLYFYSLHCKLLIFIQYYILIKYYKKFYKKKSISWKSSLEGFIKCSLFVYRHGTILQGICTEKRPCMMKPSYTIPLIRFWPEIPKSSSRFRIIFPPNSSAKDGPQFDFSRVQHLYRFDVPYFFSKSRRSLSMTGFFKPDKTVCSYACRSFTK